MLEEVSMTQNARGSDEHGQSSGQSLRSSKTFRSPRTPRSRSPVSSSEFILDLDPGKSPSSRDTSQTAEDEGRKTSHHNAVHTQLNETVQETEHCIVDIVEPPAPRKYGVESLSFSTYTVNRDPRFDNGMTRNTITTIPEAASLTTRSPRLLSSTPIRIPKHSGSILFNANKYSQEFNMITKRHGTSNVRFCETATYNTCYIVVILLYAILLGISTASDWHHISPVGLWLIFATRYLFTALFAVDLALNLSGMGFIAILERPELVFDTFLLVVEGVSLIWLTVLMNKFCYLGNPQGSMCRTVIKQFRLASCITLFRMYRICMICQPLSSLSKGIALSIRSLMWTGVFVLLVIYSCAIFTTLTFTDAKDELMVEFWGTLPQSMYTLFTILTLEGWNEVSKYTSIHYPYAKIFFVIFVCFATLTVMNVVTGIILDTFLTANEKLTGEKACKGKCKRQLTTTQIITDALNYVTKRDYMGDSPPGTARSMLQKHGAGKQSKETACNSMEPISPSSDGGYKRLGLRSLGKVMQTFVRSIRKIPARTNTLLTKTTSVAQPAAHSKTSSRSHSYQRRHLSAACRANRFGAASAGSHRPLRFYTHHYSREFQKCRVTYRSVSVHRKSDNSNILRELMDDSVESPPCAPPSWGSVRKQPDLQSREGVQGAFMQGYSKHSEAGSIRHAMYDGSIETEKLLATSTSLEIIDMTDKDPYTFLSDPTMQKALGLAGVPMYQAYEVLNLYYVNELYRITVADFVGACDRLTGNATNRDMLSFELAMTRRLDTIEIAMERVDRKLEALIGALNNSAHSLQQY